MDKESMFPVIKGLFESAYKLIEDHNIKMEKFTQDQIASVIVQAVLCGDLQKNIVKETCALPFLVDGGETHFDWVELQSVTYLPYRQLDSLRAEVARLKEEIEKLKGKP